MKDNMNTLTTLSGNKRLFAAPSVLTEPKSVLTNWRVFECSWHHGKSKTIHFIGDVNDISGRVTSSIKSFKSDLMIGVSNSGREYELSGPSGFSLSAEEVWEDWQMHFGAPEVKEITKKYEL